MRHLPCLILVGLLVFGPFSAVRGDETFVLTRGGQIVGQLQNPDQSPRTTYVIKTSEGSQVTLARSQVKEVVSKDPTLAEYEKIRPRYGDTAEEQWALAEWCQERNLAQLRRDHLERVVEVDPNHANARRALGYVWINGQWTTQKDRKDKEGYKLYKGRWVTQQEIDLAEEKEKVEAAERVWIQKVNRWVGWLSTDRARLGEESLLDIRDPVAIRALAAAMKGGRTVPPPTTRRLLAQVLAKIESPAAVKVLAHAAMEDDDDELRNVSIDLLKKKKDSATVDYFVNQLRSKDNKMIVRAAVALKELGDASAIGPLIETLVTVHKFKTGSDSGGGTPMSMSFGGQRGGSNGGMSFNAGGGGPKIVAQQMFNRPVLEALVTLTGGVNYQYNVPAWRNWYASQKKAPAVDTRRR